MNISFVVIASLVVAFCIGVLFALMLPAWILIIVQAFFIIALTCFCCKKKR